MVLEEDAIRALRWLGSRDPLQAAVWDSDVMQAHDWGEQRTHAALNQLEQDGCITSRKVPLGDDAFSLGFLQVTRTGLRRLREPLVVRPHSDPA